jgi:hypothetical protein
VSNIPPGVLGATNSSIPTDSTAGVLPDAATSRPTTPSTFPSLSPAPATLNPDHLSAAANAAPTLSPAETLGVASSSTSVPDAGVRAQSVAASKLGSKLADLFRKLDDASQTKLWAQVPPAIKSLMVGQNYHPPTSIPQAANEGWWNTLVHYADDARHAVSVVGNQMKQDLVYRPSEVFNAAFKPVNDLYQGFAYNYNQNQYALGTGHEDLLGGLGNVFDPASILRDYNSVYSGKLSFQPEAVMYVQQQLGVYGPKFQLAQALAKGASLQQILMSVPQSQRPQVATFINTNENFKKAVSILSDSGLSLGQTLFGGLSAQQQHQLMPYTSLGRLQLATGVKAVTGAAEGALSLASGAGEAAGTEEGILTAARALGTARAAASGMTLGAGVVGAAASQITGKTPDMATQISPFGKPINPLSGMVDGFANWYANPLNRGIQFAHMAKDAERARVLMDAMGDSKSVEYTYTNSPKYVRFAKSVANAVTKDPNGGAALSEHPNFAELERLGIDPAGLEEQIKAYYPDIKAGVEAGTPEVGVARMLADNQAKMNLLRGRWSNSYRNSGSLPYLTLRQETIDRVLGVGKKAFQGERFNLPKFGLLQSVKMLGAQREIEAARLMENADPTAKLGLMARWGRRLTNEVPVGPLDLTAPNAATKFQQLARIGLPERQVADVYNQFLRLGPEDLSEKRALVYSTIRQVMANLGVADSPQGAKFLTDWEKTQHYAYGDIGTVVDPLNPTGPRIPAALLPSQTSHIIGLPKFSELYQFSRKSRFMRLFNLGLNNRGLDYFMSHFWKRSMLFRTAFGIRFASEEALNFLLRNDVHSYVQARIAASATNAANASRDALLERAGNAIKGATDEELKQYAEDVAASKGLITLGDKAAAGDLKSINELDAHILGYALYSDIPTPILKLAVQGERDSLRGTGTLQWRIARNKLFNPSIATSDLREMFAGGNEEQANRLMAAALVSHSVSWLEKAQMRMAGDRLLNAALNLARRGVLRSAMADQIDAVTAHGNVFTGDNPVAQNVHELVKTVDGEPLRIKANSGFEEVAPTDPEIYPKYAVALGGLASDPLARTAAAGFTPGGYEQQIQNVEDAIKRPDLAMALDNAQKKLDEAIARGAKPDVIEGLSAARDTHQAALDSHITSMRRVMHYNALDGVTVRSGLITQDEATRGWAQKIVDHVNNTLMTDKSQEVDATGDPIEPNGPQPIRTRPAPVPRSPFQVELGSGTHFVNPVDEKDPMRGLDKGNVRLFKAVNSKTLNITGSEFANPARTWFTSFQEASNHAGEDGTIYTTDIPVEALRKDGIFHASATDSGESANMVEHIASLQQQGVNTTSLGHFELGRLHYGAQSEIVPSLLIDYIGRGEVPGMVTLRSIPTEHLPAKFIAPQLFASASRTPGGLMNDFMEKGMENMVGRPANYISRQPIFLYNYARALDTATQGLKLAGIEDVGGDLAHDIAMERAANDTIPFIHNPAAKSQFSVITRNLMPFWFAQEQFYKRWARLFGEYPEAWYKLSLAMTGLSNVGFIYTDQYGQAAFTYPGSDFLLSMLSHVPGLHALPVGVGFSTEVNQLNPTTALGGMPIPSFGPMVTIPTDFAAVMFPGLVPLAQGLRGPNAPTFNHQGNWFDQVIQEIMPSIVNRAMEWYTTPTGDAATQGINSPIFMSSAIEAMKLMALSGHDLTTEQQKNPLLVQHYLDRLANWTKNIIGLRALFGFFSPGTPNFVFNDQGLGNELNTFLATMNYKDAIATFIKLHPNATPIDLFASTTDGTPEMPGSGSGAYIPATAQAMSYINANVDFFNNYPGLAPWTIPLSAAKGLFNGTAYEEQKNMNLRDPRTLTDAYMQMKYSEGANIYYPLDDLFKAAQGDAAALASQGITQAEAQQQLGIPAGMTNTQIKQVWEKWSANFEATHPLFAARSRVSGIEASIRRANIVSQLQNAINAGDLPSNTWTKQIGPLMQGYDEVQSFANSTKGNSGATAQRVDNYDAFIAWGTQYAKLNPEIAPFWNGVLMEQVPK